MSNIEPSENRKSYVDRFVNNEANKKKYPNPAMLYAAGESEYKKQSQAQFKGDKKLGAFTSGVNAIKKVLNLGEYAKNKKK